nr:basic secretory family protein [Mycobacterium sp. GA-2829]
MAEFVSAVLLLDRPEGPTAPPPLAAATAQTPDAAEPAEPGPTAVTTQLPDGRSAEFVALGGPDTTRLLSRVAAELPAATDAVSRFWGPDWRRELVIVATASSPQFTALAGGGADIAAATTADRILFAPGAVGMNDADLRIVLRHELFHHAVRDVTAADAPRWLTEGVADYVARTPEAAAVPDPTVTLPTDADLDAVGPVRSQAYDRAWRFAAYVADRYGPQRLRALYVAACGPDHVDVPTAVRESLGVDVDEVLAGWRQWPPG